VTATRKVLPALACAAAGVLAPAAAHAHLVNARFGDFYAGLIHPVTALEHVFVFVAMGLLAGQQGPRGARWVLAGFAAALIPGVAAGLHTGAGWVVYVNGVSFVAIGGLVALARRLPLALVAALAGLCGFTHGLANGAAVRPDMVAVNFVAGVVSAGVIVVSLGAGLVLGLHRPWTKIAVRVMGSWIAAIGLMTMALM
jgi:urease accessory protein